MTSGPVPNGHSHANGTTNGTLNGTSHNGTIPRGRPAQASRPRDPIAIIGISAKFGGSATDATKLWDMVAGGETAWSPIPKERFDSHALGGHFLSGDIGLFDAGFFNLSADAASAMDPQLRILLESVHEAFENAGIPLDKAAGSETSVYTGVYGKDYHELQTRDPEALPAAFLTGNGTAMLMVGKDGRCYAWDARAEGYGRGEGVASLILKRLDAALADGDHIHGVIRESGLNQDGATKSITSPSIEAQIKLIEKCYSRAGLSLSDTGYVEAHMTGTPVGDLAEATALSQTFGRARKTGDPMYVGSVKTNVGHTEPVSGLAGIIKTIYAMKNRVIPPNMNYETPSPKIPLEQWNLAVPTSLTPWPKDKALRASINNFGYGGANSHVILEAAPASATVVESKEDTRSRIFILSAKDQVALKGMIGNLATYVKAIPENESLGAIAYTLSERRSKYPWLAAVRASTSTELIEGLSQSSLKGTHATKKPRLGFVLNGQGAQWHAMGRELLAAYPVFGDAVHRADAILKGYGASWSLYEELLRDAKTTRVGQMQLSQPVTVALQLCLLDLLTSWGIKPAALSSHSSGEIAAAYAVGVLSFAEALGAAFYRGDIPSRSEELSKLAGGMLAAGLSREEVAQYLADTDGGRVVVACVNSPDSITISGDLHAIDEVEARLTKEGVFARKLKVPLAYHSHHMQLLAKEYTDRLRETITSQPDETWTLKYRYASPVTGEIVRSAKSIGPEYFVHNLTNPVLFSQAFEKMCFEEDGSAQVDVVVEIGAHGTLAGPIRQIFKGREIPYVSTLSRNVDAVETMQNLAAELLGRGVDVSLAAVNSPFGEKYEFKHDLPTYAWNHSTRYWIEPRINKDLRNKKFEPHELLGSLLPGDNGLAPTWRNFLRLTDISWLSDHQIQGYVVLPGAGYIAMAIEATKLLAGRNSNISGFQLKDIEVLNALTIPDTTTGVEVQISMHPAKDDWYEYVVSSLTLANTWTTNCTGFVRAEKDQLSVASIRTDEYFHPGVKPTDVDPESLWSDLRKMSMYHGPVFRPITSIKTARDKAITDITLKDAVSETHDYVIHPTTLDGIFIAAYNGLPRKIRDAFTVVPRKIKGITIRSDLHRKGGEDIICLSQVHSADTSGFDSTISVTNGGESGDMTLQVEHFFAQAIPREAEDGEEKACIISRLEWEADLTSTVPATFVDTLKVMLEDDTQSDLERKIRRVAFHFIHDAVKELELTPESVKPAHEALFNWMKDTVAEAAAGKLGPRSDTWARTSKGTKTKLTDDVNAMNIASTRLLVRVGQHLPQILRADIDADTLVNADSLLSQYYTDHPKLEGVPFKQLGKVLEQLAINRPGAHVLEIGAGAGTLTRTVLEAFGAKHGADGSRTVLGQIDCTDPSLKSFDALAQRTAAWSDLVNLKRLDIEKDLGEQDFAPSSYDLIVVSQLLHKTASLHAALANVHELLKPGGKLLFVETTQEQLDQKLVFGVLPESNASHSLQAWDSILCKMGFSGIQLSVGDSENAQNQSFSVILTEKLSQEMTYPAAISIVHTGDAPPESWTQELRHTLEAESGVVPNVENLFDVTVSPDTVYIFTPELASPFVAGLDRPSFEKLKGFLTAAQDILWLSRGGLVDAQDPLIGATSGLLRVVRQEDAGKRCVHLDFAKKADGELWEKETIGFVVDVFKKAFARNNHVEDFDWEYSVKDGVVCVPRLYPEIQVEEPELASLNIDSSDATYLVVGGMGGIGQYIASWLMEKSAKNLLIVSRNAEASPDVASMRMMAQADDCNLQIRSCDVGNEQKFLELLADVATTMPPIRGVINAAMVLQNSILDNMSYDVWQSGIRPKLDSSINIHKHLPSLTFFIQLSSAIGIPGHPSQAHYAAGNTFQDALARHRTAHGLPATTLNLTAIEGVGWMAQQGDAELDVVKRIAKVGLTSARIDTVMDLVESAIRTPLHASPAASQVVLGMSTYAALPDASVVKADRRFGTLRLASLRAGAQATSSNSDTKDPLTQLSRAAADKSLTISSANALVIEALASKLSTVFSFDASDVDPERSLSSYGVDSLVAVELRNWLAGGLKAKVSIFDILQSPSLGEFADVLVGRSELLAGLE
ncbi:putative PKS-like protein biosynthetic cluster [Didymella heteroderae]|uniref:PKS-like protein biosynthetic cluster n=1 Tax=Didymella heteroderae TaxID=1769908 RepID=A0A9P4WQG4_9PLEO|nr:putative PKS-like protein biosynthetic cluster [Didymella heteroderae]